eukprot:562896-Rhodomonas_salina.1
MALAERREEHARARERVRKEEEERAETEGRVVERGGKEGGKEGGRGKEEERVEAPVSRLPPPSKAYPNLPGPSCVMP